MAPTSLDNALIHCREKVCPEFSSLHYALLFQPVKDQAFWLGVFTLLHEIKRATHQQLEAGLTQVKLGWWKHALAQASTGSPQHPVMVALGETALGALNDEQWGELIAQTVDATEVSRHDTFDDWLNHCKASLTLWAKLPQAHFNLKQNDDVQRFWASSLALTQVLRLAKYIDIGFQPLPVSWLAKYEVTAESLKQRQHSDNTTKLFNAAYQSLKEECNGAWKAMLTEDRMALRPLRALQRMRMAELEQHLRGEVKLLTEQKSLTPMKKFSLSWTTHVFKK